MPSLSKIVLLAAAHGAAVYGQTFSSCNPVLKSGCPSDPALGKAVEYDFTKGAPEDFSVAAGTAPTFDSDGGKFTIAKALDSPTITSKWYMMFGHYDITLQTAKGVGTVSTIVLQSDDLDEVDWEWLGSDAGHVQTNYYGKGNTTVYDRGMTLPNDGNQDGFHTYSLDWTADAITWSIDGKEVRKLTPQTADANQYPQSPMQLKLGVWPGGDPSEPAGTISWAGGKIDYSKGPYTMTVKSVKAIDYSTGKSYSYGDQTGSWESIKSDGGQINSKGDPNAKASQAAASGTAVADSTTAAKLDQPPPTGTGAVTTGSSPSGTGQPSNGTAASMTTVVSGSTVVAPKPTGNTTVTNGTAAGASSTGSPAGSAAASATKSGASGVPSQANAAGTIGSSVATTGLMVMVAAALLM